MKRIPIILALLLAITGCYNDKALEASLREAESRMDSAPDSAYAILQSIDAASIKSTRQRALYALLYSQALDKNYIDETNDSLISIAVDYYKSGNDIRHRMLARYYNAVVLYNATKYDNSISMLLLAERDALELDDNFYLSRIYSKISDIYSIIYNNNESLIYAQSALEKISKTDYHRHKLWAKLNLGRAYNNCTNYERSIPIFNEVIDSAYTRRDTILLINALRLASISHLAKHNYSDTKRLLNTIMSIDSSQLSVDDYRNLGDAYLWSGQLDSAIICMNILHQINPSEQWLAYEINKIQHNYKEALTALEHENSVTDSLFLKIIRQNISTIATSYRKNEKQRIENELEDEKQTKYYLSAIIVIIVIIVIFSIIIYRQRIKNYNTTIEKNILLAQNLKTTLELKKSENKEMQKAINSLFEQRYETVNNLCDIYFHTDAHSNKQDKVYKQVKNIINNFGSDSSLISKLEEYANKYLDNIMIKFRNDFPNLKESDIRLFLYSAIGFSSRAISTFLNENISVIYNRKSRLKSKISNSTSPEKHTFINYIS